MQYLVLVSRNAVAPKEPPTAAEREAESEFVRHLHAEGMVRQIWLRDGGAVILAEAADAQSLEQTFATLPLVQSGFLDAPTVIRLQPYPGFGPRGPLG
ncbi:hypothetical protein [Cupriavidus pauculus]|uniref:Muconolactone isomerase domain-containing protein n=1 Tax=Cupriavidus pauculus TaxID=82633 RepID=A0A2N5CE81_9BURK|nr:hypothetical protein [Cupriavidus pauculus]PLQ00550.1 hypothetical protein CYJ10_08725 [Cupriavidus pauculus]